MKSSVGSSSQFKRCRLQPSRHERKLLLKMDLQNLRSLNIQNKLCLQSDSGTYSSTSQPGWEGRKERREKRQTCPTCPLQAPDWQINRPQTTQLALLFSQTTLAGPSSFLKLPSVSKKNTED